MHAFSGPTTTFWMKIGHPRRRWSPMTLVSGNIWFMRILADVPWRRGVKRQCRLSTDSKICDLERLWMAILSYILFYTGTSTVCGKKVSPKVFLPFSQQPLGIFTWNFTHILLIRNHVKLPSNIVLFLIMTKLLNFLGDHVVISDVHGMFAERRTSHILQCDAKIRRDLNNKINNSPILEVSIVSFHARI